MVFGIRNISIAVYIDMLKFICRAFTELQMTFTPQYLSKRLEQIGSLYSFTLEECKREILLNREKSNLVFLSGIHVSQTELEMLARVVNCLKEEELKEVKIPIPTRKEIAETLKCDMWEVTKFIILQKSHMRMHEFLIARIKRGEALPKNHEEVKKMMLHDPWPRTKTTMFLQHKKQKYSKAQQKYDYTKRQKK
jgi:hypothetical protein